MNLSPEFFKALWLEASHTLFLAEQGAGGAIFCINAEEPTHVRGWFLSGVLGYCGPEYWQHPIQNEDVNKEAVWDHRN